MLAAVSDCVLPVMSCPGCVSAISRSKRRQIGEPRHRQIGGYDLRALPTAFYTRSLHSCGCWYLLTRTQFDLYRLVIIRSLHSLARFAHQRTRLGKNRIHNHSSTKTTIHNINTTKHKKCVSKSHVSICTDPLVFLHEDKSGIGHYWRGPEISIH